jgi:hypothetical protein
MLSTEERNARVVAVLKKTMPSVTNFSFDIGSPTTSVGHSQGINTSLSLVRRYRKDYRRGSLNVEPQQVIEVLNQAGIRRWVLMGLYGYAGYLAEPRATQDVDILIGKSEFNKAVEAIRQKWPALIVDKHEVVVRFRDPGEIAIDGDAKQVIDAMLPSNPCYEAILKTHHTTDKSTGNRIPILEAACASKFAAMVSPFREIGKKMQDAVDLRNIMAPNVAIMDKKLLQNLGDLVYPDGGLELLEYLQLTIDKKPFPI